MKYLRALFSQLEKERQDSLASNDSGVSLQLAGVEIPVQVETMTTWEWQAGFLPLGSCFPACPHLFQL